jgi:DDE superfamily endonuclease
LYNRANQYAEKSNGVFYGPFGAIDGMAVRIRRPTEKDIPDAGNYYCRKGFYALNIQGLCDMSKRFLWSYPSNKGSTHDSIAFANSRLYDLLKEKSMDLYNRGIFIAGDTAYSLTPFLIVPYDINELNRDVDGAKDAFNYHLSACRIYIECAFGELVMRFGILWRTLLFGLKKSANVVQVCMLLHNFIIDCRENLLQDQDDDSYFQHFEIEMDTIQRELTRQTGELPRAIVTDNNEPRIGGRPTLEEAEMRRLGQEVRQRLTVKLASKAMRHPLQHDMHYNSQGHIYFT